MGAVNRDSVPYAARYTNKYLGDARTGFGNPVPMAIDVTIASAANIGDSYNLFVIPAYWRFMFGFFTTDGLGTSVTMAVGDSGSSTRYLAATSFATSGLTAFLAPTGIGYTPTVDTIVLGTVGGAAGTVGKKFLGYCMLQPPAG